MKPEDGQIFTTMHEMAHLVGPTSAQLSDGSSAPFSDVFGNSALNIEEAKGDVGGLFIFEQLMGEGYFPAEQRSRIYAAYLTSVMAYARNPDESEDHRAGALIALNTMLQPGGGLRFDATTGRLAIDEDAVRATSARLLDQWLTIQRTGDVAAFEALKQERAVVSPPLAEMFRRLDAARVPLETQGFFTLKDQLEGR
jgi:hypothetical protein